MGVGGTRGNARTWSVAAAGLLAMTVGAVAPPAASANEPVQPRTARHATPVSRGDDRSAEPLPQGVAARAEHRQLAGLREQRAHDIAEAATWQVDPALLQSRPTDSPATAAAREQLAVLSDRVREQVATYDDLRERAASAVAVAQRARSELGAARDAVAAAQARYQTDRELLVSVLTEDYTRTQLAPLAAVLTGDDDGSLPGDLTMLDEMGRIQDGAVHAAERSRSRLQAAERDYASAAGRAGLELRAARAAAEAALQARDEVLAELDQAQTVLTDSVLADQAALAAKAAQAARAARAEAADGHPGDITFPLAPGTPFVDQNNFGGRSEHWATVHTGDDFSSACGSPVVAATDGTVVIRTDQAWAGSWLVMVSTAEGSLTTWYAHMQAVDVTDGQQVHAGDPLGEVGQEGNATGCHLHFEVHPRGGSIYEDDTDPETWLHEVGAYPTGS